MSIDRITSSKYWYIWKKFGQNFEHIFDLGLPMWRKLYKLINNFGNFTYVTYSTVCNFCKIYIISIIEKTCAHMEWEIQDFEGHLQRPFLAP